MRLDRQRRKDQGRDRDKLTYAGLSGVVGLVLGALASVPLAWVMETGFASLWAPILFSGFYFAGAGWVLGLRAADLAGVATAGFIGGLSASWRVDQGGNPIDDDHARAVRSLSYGLGLIVWALGMCLMLWLFRSTS